MTLEAGLVFSRFLHFTCTIILFGSAFFALYSLPFGGPSERLTRPLESVLLTATLGAFLSSLAWLLFTVGNMSGTLAGAFDGEALRSVLWDTGFGHVWAARVALMLAIVATIWLGGACLRSYRLIAILAVLAAVLLASLAGVGHTQVHGGTSAMVHVTVDAVHLLAAGAWLGGLLPLGMLVVLYRTKQLSSGNAVLVLSRFSGMAYFAVAALVASGSINGWFLIGSLSTLISTSYGELLLMKLGLFGLMLCLAASNRFRLVPGLTKMATANRSDLALATLRHNIVAEQILGIFVMAIVSLLGTLPPTIQG